MKKVVLSGASGLVGKALAQRLNSLGYEVISINRKDPSHPYFFNYLDLPQNIKLFENLEAWIHLGGETIQGIRWTQKKKDRIFFSRIHSNQGIKKLIAALDHPPKKLMIASGVGFYGSKTDGVMREGDCPGDGFLAKVAAGLEGVWESNLQRPIFMRFAPVFSIHGGALTKLLMSWKQKMLFFFGNKEAYFPVITLEELLKMIVFVLQKENLSGPINFCNLKPITQEKLFRKLSQVFKPKIVLRIPNLLIRLLLGEMGKETLLIDQQIEPKVLKEIGYPFDDEKMFDELVQEIKKGD